MTTQRKFSLLAAVTLAGVLALSAPPARAADAGLVPLWDGEAAGPEGPAANRFGGGAPIPGILATISHTTLVKRSGNGALRLDTNGSIAAGGFDYVVVPFTGNLPGSVDTRDLGRFVALRFWLRNDTGEPFTLGLEIKDYRDDNAHKARRRVVVNALPTWTEVVAPLDLGQGWQVFGAPDLGRARNLALVLEADLGLPVSGSVFFDDMVLVEADSPLEVATTPIDTLVEHLTRRQFAGLWGARDRDHGLVPAVSAFADLCATNVLAAVVQLLPGAVQRNWVAAADADAWVAQVVTTLDALMDDARYLPPRYVNRLTLARGGPEESSVDAAMLFLSLYRYAARPGLDTGLRDAILGLLGRFQWSPFVSTSPAGWHLAYSPDRGMTSAVYDGYSGEPWLISLAASLSSTDPVPIETLYHSAVLRVRDHLVDPGRAHVVHSMTDFRPPFAQWLLPLFVDTSDRGPDSYPEPALATEPRANAVLYQREADAALAAAGRPLLLQPDAGDDGSGAFYRQFSAYEDFGRPDLYMPWSVGFVFLAEPAVAEPALRKALATGLHGPFGLSDSAHWTTGAAAPSSFPARHDLWNTALLTLAFAEHLWHESADLAAIPAVAAGLDRVYPIFRDGFESGDSGAWDIVVP